MTNQDIAQRLKDLKVQHKETIFDSSEPKSIQELINCGVFAEHAEKGADSVNNSIDILKRYKLNITQSSVNLLKELRTYKWLLDKTGNGINKPIDKNNHAIDSLRYVALNKLSEDNSGEYFLA